MNSRITPGAVRAVAALAVVVILLFAANLLFTSREVGQLRHAVRTQCRFDADVGDVAAVPVMVNPATHKASKLGIAIIADSRTAFRGLGCTGTLARPGPSFIRWARYYHLSAS